MIPGRPLFVMKTLLTSLGVVLSIGSLACKKEPCGGAGMEVDPRPMTEAWEETVGVPEGATVCRARSGSSPLNQRHFAYLDKEPAALLKLLRSQMEEHGWKVVRIDESEGPKSSHCTTSIFYEKKKQIANVSVSECEGRTVKGWATVYLPD